MNHYICLGVDAGVSKPPNTGAIAIITPKGAAVRDLPGLDGETELVQAIAPYLDYKLPMVAKVEDQNLWHSDIAKHSQWEVLKLIRHMQMCISVLRVLGCGVTVERTVAWKSSLGLTGEGKAQTFDLMMQLFPECRPMLQYRIRKWHNNHNRSDALAIAYSLKLQVEQQEQEVSDASAVSA